MLDIQLHALGTRQPSWVNQGVAEYTKRLKHGIRLQLIELPLAKSRHDVARALSDEAKRLLNAIPTTACKVALDIQGEAWSSVQLAQQLQRWQREVASVALLVGGPDGLADSILQRCQARWSLSALTLPHGLVRVVVAEQLYRAWSILQGHPYHRA